MMAWLAIETINNREHHGENDDLCEKGKERLEVNAATCYESLIIRQIQQLSPWR